MSSLWIWLHDYVKGREAAEKMPSVEYHEESHRMVVAIDEDGTPIAEVVRAREAPPAGGTQRLRRDHSSGE